MQCVGKKDGEMCSRHHEMDCHRVALAVRQYRRQRSAQSTAEEASAVKYEYCTLNTRTLSVWFYSLSIFALT